MTANTQECMRCGCNLPLDAFAVLPSGNHRRWCKECHRDYKKAWKKTPKGEASERLERKRNGRSRQQRFKEENPERYAEMNREASRRYYRRNKERVKEKNRRLHRAAPERMYAGQLVRALVFFGIVERGVCEECGAEDAQAHHPDHAQPLRVHWLCQACHGKLNMVLRDPEAATEIAHISPC